MPTSSSLISTYYLLFFLQYKTLPHNVFCHVRLTVCLGSTCSMSRSTSGLSHFYCLFLYVAEFYCWHVWLMTELTGNCLKTPLVYCFLLPLCHAVVILIILPMFFVLMLTPERLAANKYRVQKLNSPFTRMTMMLLKIVFSFQNFIHM